MRRPAPVHRDAAAAQPGDHQDAVTAPDRRGDGAVRRPGSAAGLPSWALVGLALWFTVLLSVWAAFLVPLRAGSVPVPAWIAPLGLMVWLGWTAARRVGLWGALGPALTWLTLTWLVLGSRRGEGDLVIPGTALGYAYLFGGFVPWLVVVALASAGRRRHPPAQPRGQGGR